MSYTIYGAESVTIHLEKKKSDSELLSHTIHKINSRWIASLNTKCKIIQLLEENLGEEKNKTKQKPL